VFITNLWLCCTLPRDVAVRKTTRRETKRVRSDMMFWRLLHDKHIPWPCIVNSLKKNFASTCLCFHSGNHKSITLGGGRPVFLGLCVVWWFGENWNVLFVPWFHDRLAWPVDWLLAFQGLSTWNLLNHYKMQTCIWRIGILFCVNKSFCALHKTNTNYSTEYTGNKS